MAGSGTAHLRGDEALLSVQDLVVEYPSKAGTVQAVSKISFDLLPGETLASSVNPDVGSRPPAVPFCDSIG